MSDMGESQGRPKTPIIETAAGTTNPDNNKSGRKAYVIAAAAMAALLLIGSGVTGCLNLAMDVAVSAAHEYGGSSSQPYTEQYPDQENYSDPWDMIDDYMDNRENTYYDNGQQRPDDMSSVMGGKVTAADALGSELAMYSSTIDAALAQSSYANAQQSVRDFVRALVIVDRDASSEIASSLHSAAWNDKDLTQAIDDAKKKAEETIASLQEAEMPKVTGSKAKDVEASLESGRKHAIERWEAVVSELDLLSTDEKLESSTVSDADKKVIEAAQQAADDFASAMEDSLER